MAQPARLWIGTGRDLCKARRSEDGKRLRNTWPVNTSSLAHVSELFEDHGVVCPQDEDKIIGVALLAPSRVYDHTMILDNGEREQVYFWESQKRDVEVPEYLRRRAACPKQQKKTAQQQQRGARILGPRRG